MSLTAFCRRVGARPLPHDRKRMALPTAGGRKALPYYVLAVLLAVPALGQGGLPRELDQVGLEQKVGGRLPLGLELTAHDGSTVRLGDYFGARPVILAPVYYDCPMLCSMVLEGLTKSLKAVTLEPGADFNVLAVSFDARETPAQASRQRARTIERYGRPAAAGGLHFLTGDDQAVGALMDAIGFSYRFDDETGEFAHASTVVVLTPDGVVSRYFPGVEYPPRDLRLSLVEAGDRQIGGVVDKVLLYCFKYDPTSGRYTAATMNLIRAGGLLTLAVMGGFVYLSLRRERRRRAAGARA